MAHSLLRAGKLLPTAFFLAFAVRFATNSITHFSGIARKKSVALRFMRYPAAFPAAGKPVPRYCSPASRAAQAPKAPSAAQTPRSRSPKTLKTKFNTVTTPPATGNPSSSFSRRAGRSSCEKWYMAQAAAAQRIGYRKYSNMVLSPQNAHPNEIRQYPDCARVCCRKQVPRLQCRPPKGGQKA